MDPTETSSDGGFEDLTAVFVNGSLQHRAEDSHTMRLIARVAGVMRTEGVTVEVIHALDHDIAFGMRRDMTQAGADRDDWPAIHDRILAADIFVLGTPIWLGAKSSVATMVIERMYASSGELNDRGQYQYYGKAAGCLVTGNEDGVKACARDVLYCLQHIGYTVPPQADAGWIGEAGPGPSYGDELDGAPPAGYDNEFTNKNATIMAWNLMHTARLLRDAGGFPARGNQPEKWREVTNAASQDPTSLG